MIIALSVLEARAKERPPGYLEEVLASGAVVGPNLDIPVEALRALRGKYRGVEPQANPPECRSCGKQHDHE